MLRLAFKLARIELLNSRRFALFFILNLTVGLCGFVLLNAFNSSLRSELRQGSRQLHTADLTFSCQNRWCKDSELQQLRQIIAGSFRESELVSTFTMLAKDQRTQLVQVAAVSSNYPLYGAISTQPQDVRTARNSILIQPETASRLAAQVGDSLRLGGLQLTVSATILKDSSSGASSFGFVPRVYLSIDDFRNSELIVAGSRFRHTFGYASEGLSQDQWDRLRDELIAAFPARDIEISSHQQASENMARSMGMLSNYLSLIALIALFLTAIGSGFLLRSHIIWKSKNLAIFQALGASTLFSQLVYLMQVAILGVCSAGLALIITQILLPFVPALLGPLLPIPIHPVLSIEVILLSLAMGSFGSVLACLPLVVRIGGISAISLLRESVRDTSNRRDVLIASIPIVLLYAALAFSETRSLTLSAAFLGSILICFTIFMLAASALLSLLPRQFPKSFALQTTLRQVGRQKLASASCILAIAFGTTLVCSIPQIYRLVYDEISNPDGVVVPSLFMIDIQEDQLEPIAAWMRDQKLPLEHVSPMVRARLVAINDVQQARDDSAKKSLSREEDDERWARNRGQNLSYRLHLANSEKIVSGKEFSASYSGKGLPPISLEYRYAQRLGVTVGDRLTFDVQGVPIEGEIINLRRVRWTSFQPNFFVLFPPGVLDDAPKIFLASVPPTDDQTKFAVQDALIQQFPNVSVVDVKNTVDRILLLAVKMTEMISVMAWFTVFAGFVVITSIFYQQAFRRRRDYNLLKILGMDLRDLKSMIVYESTLLAFVGVILGFGASIGFSFALAKIVFDSTPTTNYATALLSAVAILTLSPMVAIFAMRHVFRDRVSIRE